MSGVGIERVPISCSLQCSTLELATRSGWFQPIAKESGHHLEASPSKMHEHQHVYSYDRPRMGMGLV